MKTTHTSYGIIPVCRKDEQVYICCVKNRKSGEWGLPKGTPDNNETPIETATRELKEETGIEVIKITDYPILKESYTFEQDSVMHSKTCKYFIGLVDEMVGQPIDKDGIDEVKWIKIGEASHLFKFQNLINVVKTLEGYLLNFPIINQ